MFRKRIKIWSKPRDWNIFSRLKESISLFYARSLESKTLSQRFYLPLNLSIHLICPSTILTLFFLFLLYLFLKLQLADTTDSFTPVFAGKNRKKGQENFSYTFLSHLKFEISARNCAHRFVKSSRKVGTSSDLKTFYIAINFENQNVTDLGIILRCYTAIGTYANTTTTTTKSQSKRTP